MKKKIFNFYLYILHILVFLSCYFNSPKLCAYLLKISLFKQKSSKKKFNDKKIVLVLYRAIGERDIRIIQDASNKIPRVFFIRRTIVKLIFYYFSGKKKIFFNYLKPGLSFNEEDYFNQSKKNKVRLEKFWTDVIFNLKRHFKNKILNLVTFNINYYAEISLYASCKRNGVPVKLWYKECFRSPPEVDHLINSNRYNHVLKFFEKISVYNKFMKDCLTVINGSNTKKISINGCPRKNDYINKKKYYKKIRNILFLSFHNKKAIPQNKNTKNLNWNLTYNKTIKILNELSKDKNIDIIIKRKKSAKYEPLNQVSKNIKIFEEGPATNYINQADIIIGQNSASSIEALINGKIVMIPFFEKNKKLKKYLFNFNKQIIYSSEKKIKKDILTLINKKVLFPLKNTKHQKTISYYYGNPKNIIKNYENFLNN